MENRPYTVVVWGDSIAASGWPQKTEFILNVALNLGRTVRVVNEGVGGMPAAKARHLFEEKIRPHAPDLVIVQFGFNDARYDGSRDRLPISTLPEFRDHLAAMIGACRQVGAEVLVFGNHPARRIHRMPDGRPAADVYAEYARMAGTTARERGVRFFSLADGFAAVGWAADDFLSEDGVHLSPRGLEGYAQMAADQIQSVMVETGVVRCPDKNAVS